MSYETNHCNRIVCDYPDCDATTRLWREDEDSAYSDADDLKWLTIEVELDGDEYVDKHFCTSHLDTMRNPIPAGSYHLPDNTPKDWHTWGEGYMYPIYEPCIPTILNVLEKATPDNPLPNELVEKCALALFRTDTNWAENNPTKREVLDLWEQQMPCIQEQFLKRAYTVLHEALLVEFPNMRE